MGKPNKSAKSDKCSRALVNATKNLYRYLDQGAISVATDAFGRKTGDAIQDAKWKLGRIDEMIRAGRCSLALSVLNMARRSVGLPDLKLEPYSKREVVKRQRCVLQGKDIPHAGARTYEVCLSKTQAQKLFRQQKFPRRLGCGAFACAYDKSKTRVVKITRDESDVAALVKAQGIPEVVKVYGRPKLLVDANPEEPVFAVEVEKTGPTVKDLGYPFRHYHFTFLGARGEDIRPKDILDVANRACTLEFPAVAPRNQCKKYVSHLLRADYMLRRIGIDWQDAHLGNVAIKNGKPKILDLGLAGAEFDEPPEPLKGVRRRARKRKKYGRRTV